MKDILLFILVILSGKLVFACTCIQLENYSLKSEFKDRDLIFLGTVTEIDTITVKKSNFSIDEIWYTFKLKELYKGKVQEKTIKIKSGAVGADDCKFTFLLNNDYVVYANYLKTKERKKKKKALNTNICTNTGEATETKIFEARNNK